MDRNRELPARVERRLSRVLQRARRTLLPGLWHYEEFAAEAFPAAVRGDALALVRGPRGWSQLVPLESTAPSAAQLETLRFWTFEFPVGVPNSGFVGWLASRIKAETGAGVVVVCGYSAEHGGVFDHWGCPAEAADEVVALIERLAGSPAPEGLSLDGCVMNATATAPNGVIGVETVFHFRQRGERVWAQYSGGRLLSGYLVGRVRGAEFSFRYCQQHDDGALAGGASECTLERLDDGRLQIREEFEWADGGRGVNLITELPA